VSDAVGGEGVGRPAAVRDGGDLVTDTDRGPVDLVAAVLGWVLLVAVGGVLGILSITSVMITGGCGINEDDPWVCNIAYFSTVLIGYWVALAAIAVASLAAIVRARRAGRLSWWRPIAGLAVVAAATGVFVLLMTR